MAANTEPMVGVLDSTDVFAVPELETNGAMVEERNGESLIGEQLHANPHTY